MGWKEKYHIMGTTMSDMQDDLISIFRRITRDKRDTYYTGTYTYSPSLSTLLSWGYVQDSTTVLPMGDGSLEASKIIIGDPSTLAVGDTRLELSLPNYFGYMQPLNLTGYYSDSAAEHTTGSPSTDVDLGSQVTLSESGTITWSGGHWTGQFFKDGITHNYYIDGSVTIVGGYSVTVVDTYSKNEHRYDLSGMDGSTFAIKDSCSGYKMYEFVKDTSTHIPGMDGSCAYAVRSVDSSVWAISTSSGSIANGHIISFVLWDHPDTTQHFNVYIDSTHIDASMYGGAVLWLSIINLTDYRTQHWDQSGWGMYYYDFSKHDTGGDVLKYDKMFIPRYLTPGAYEINQYDSRFYYTDFNQMIDKNLDSDKKLCSNYYYPGDYPVTMWADDPPQTPLTYKLQRHHHIYDVSGNYNNHDPISGYAIYHWFPEYNYLTAWLSKSIITDMQFYCNFLTENYTMHDASGHIIDSSSFNFLNPINPYHYYLHTYIDNIYSAIEILKDAS